MKNWATCQNGECKCGLIWDKDLDIPIAKVLSSKDKEMLGCGLIPGSDEFKRVYKLLAAAPELLEACEYALKMLREVDIAIETTKIHKAINKAKGGDFNG